MLMMMPPLLRYFWFHSTYSLAASCSLQSAVCGLRSAVCKCHTPSCSTEQNLCSVGSLLQTQFGVWEHNNLFNSEFLRLCESTFVVLVKIRIRYDGVTLLWIVYIVTANCLSLTYSNLSQPSSSNKTLERTS